MPKGVKRKNHLNQELSESGVELPVTKEMQQKALKERAEDESGKEFANVGEDQKDIVEPKEAFYIDPLKSKKAEKEIAKTDKKAVATEDEIIFITGAKILKDKPVEIYFIERKVDNDEGELTYKNGALPHKDFIAAMETLKIHLAVIPGFIKSTEIANINKVAKALIEPYRITGFKIKGGEDKEGFSVSGGCFGKHGWTGLTPPMVRNINDADTGYIFIKELAKAIDKCQAEALAYRKGKHAPKDQLDIFEGSPAEEEK